MVKPIKFTADNRAYDLQFKFPDLNIIQLVGDTGSGKTLMCTDFKRQQGIDTNLDNSIVIDIDTHIDVPLYISHKRHNIDIVNISWHIFLKVITTMLI